MKPLKLALITLIGLSACQSPPKPTSVPPPFPRAKVRQDYLKPGDIKRVRTGEFVKTYHVGRSVKGRGGSTMHEAHRVYRLEKASRWNLARNQPPLASTGPVNRVVDSAFKAAPESKAVRAELNRQRELSQELEDASETLRTAARTARDKLNETANDKLDRNRLENEIDRLEGELAALRKADAPSTVPDQKSDSPSNELKQWGENLEPTKGNASRP